MSGGEGNRDGRVPAAPGSRSFGPQPPSPVGADPSRGDLPTGVLRFLQMVEDFGRMGTGEFIRKYPDCNAYEGYGYLARKGRALKARIRLRERDSDGSPEGGDGEAGSVRSTTARAEGIAQTRGDAPQGDQP